MTITEKVAHLKGLVEGMDFAESKESKVLNEVLDILEDIALTVSDLDDEMGLVTEQLDAVDEDLADLEEVFYDECEDCCDCDDDCCCDDEMYAAKQFTSMKKSSQKAKLNARIAEQFSSSTLTAIVTATATIANNFLLTNLQNTR